MYQPELCGGRKKENERKKRKYINFSFTYSRELTGTVKVIRGLSILNHINLVVLK